MTKKTYKVGGLFSGVGGIELGFSSTGRFEVLWASDIDKYSAKTYRKNHKHKFIEKDINDVKGNELEEVDVLARKIFFKLASSRPITKKEQR